MTNKSLAEKFKALKDLENGLLNEDVVTKYGAPRNSVSTWVKNKLKLKAWLGKKRNELLTKKYALWDLRKGR